MTAQFKLLADEVMRRHGEDFSKANKTRIDAVLAPLKENIGKFEAELRQAHRMAAKDREGLAAHIRSLTEQSATMSKETEALTRALRGDVRKQGAWGEITLARILERSGLREGEEYELQSHHVNEEGRRLRPDAIVRLPGERRIIVDSKVSLTDYQRAAAAHDPASRAAALKAHAGSLRAHVANLAGKEYQRLHVGDLDYVIMFVPIEGALADAVREDDALTAFAHDNDVMIATPTTLMAMLRTVANVWSVDRRNRNAEEIARRAGRLYDKAEGFVSDLTAIGGRLDQARASYDSALGRLSSGRGSLLNQIEALKTLGAKTTRALPPALLSDDGAEGPAETGESAASLDPPRAAE
jgi:DNA recombination protein RmuC